ncbi:MAG: hypothetical protein A2W08_19505 [Candidatus Rokubacteria bacterium RBG_16_73_20]|nr:MAG: hypothetical protein A2W08_19505 [Candidatus Rokubacteria bacterium RBG_16_73_20]
MRASCRVSPPASVALTRTTLRPSRSLRTRASGTSFGAARSSCRWTSTPLTVTTTRVTPLSEVTLPLSGASAAAVRAPSPGAARATVSGSGRSRLTTT